MAGGELGPVVPVGAAAAVAFIAPVDAGCDWRRLDPRFSRCVTCPLPRCRYEYPWREQQTAVQLVQQLLHQGPSGPSATPTPAPRRAARSPQPPGSGTPRVLLPQDALVHLAQQALVRNRARALPGQTIGSGGHTGS